MNINDYASEGGEQQALFEWAKRCVGIYPELEALYHVPNEGKRGRAAAGKLKAEGLRAGVPDVCLPVPRGVYGALYIEMKRPKGGRMSEEQKKWIERLRRAGNRVEVCRGFEDAPRVIMQYLGMKGCVEHVGRQD